MNLSVLKFGWEFPPYNHGGLGVACEGLVRALTKNNVTIIMILPREQAINIEKCTFITTDREPLLTIKKIDSLLQPYMTNQSYLMRRTQSAKHDMANLYGESIFQEIERYTYMANQIIHSEKFDIIHVHDWMGIKAGVDAKNRSRKPLIFHIHATEIDRTGGNAVNQTIYDIERWGMQQADSIIAVSNFTKQKIVDHYGINSEKIEVIHNAVPEKKSEYDRIIHNKSGKLILFLGRLTLQKGPDYFIQVARKILQFRPEFTFLIAGTGDMEYRSH